jgi:hypothetical protein
MKTTHRFAAFAATLALLMAPIAVAPAAAAGPQMTGDTGWNVWPDATLDAEMTVGVFYSSTVQGPNSGDYNNNGVYADGLPDGLTATLNPANGVITVSGTPEVANTDIWFSLSYQPDSETTYTIEFSNVTVLSGKTATTTSVSSAEFTHYSSVTATATVSGGPNSGTVNFYFDGNLVGSGTVGAGGVASFTGSVASSSVGSDLALKAVYMGDDTYASSEGTASTYIYGDRVLSGVALQNREPIAGSVVRLVTPTGTATGMTTVTNADGEFSFAVGTPSSLSEAKAGFIVEMIDPHVYYSSSAGWGMENVDYLAHPGVTALYEADWSGSAVLYHNVKPTWTDSTLAQPRMGQSYTDSVSAASTGIADGGGPIAITYSVSGSIPPYLTRSNGTFTSTEVTNQTSYTFTVTATTDYGSISKQFTLQALDAGVPPTFTDTTIADLQVGVDVDDAIAATGDPTITYSSTTLPPGLVLDPATGAITGTPTESGSFTVTFTATNEFGTDEFIWEPTIKAAPEIDLVLTFAPGTQVGDAQTEISAEGLKVGSTYTLYMHSTPRLLYSGIVDATGGFVWLVTLPADTEPGAHELILSGIAPDGTSMTARAWFTLLPNGRIGAISYTGPIPLRLALSGTDPLLPLGIAGALVVAGYLMTRRRAALA